MPNAALIRVTQRDLDPPPCRQFARTLVTNLKGLHGAIQRAFLWDDSYLWAFEIDGRRYGSIADQFMDQRDVASRLARMNKRPCATKGKK